MCVFVCTGWSIGWQTDWIHDGITDVTGGSEGGDPDPSGRRPAFRATGSVGQLGRSEVELHTCGTCSYARSLPPNDAPTLVKLFDCQELWVFDLIWLEFLSLNNCRKSAMPFSFPIKTRFISFTLWFENPELAVLCFEFHWFLGGLPL